MDFNRLLRKVLLGGLFVVPFIPFIFVDFLFFPFITGKNFTFRFLVEFLFLVWAVLALRDQSFRPTWSPLVAAFGAFLVAMGLATLFSEYPLRSFWSNFERMEGYITLIHLFGYFVLLISTLHKESYWENLLKTSLGASVLMSFYGIFQLVGWLDIHQGSTRLDGTLGNATYLAVYLIFHIFIAAFLALRASGKRNIQILYGAIALLEIVILYYTATRGAILGLIGGAFLSGLIILLFDRENRFLRKVGIGIVAALVILVGMFFAFKDSSLVTTNPVLSRFASISLEEQTTKSRFLVWNMAWQGFKERPIIGWGQENFNYVFNKYYNPEMYNQEPWFDRSHNVFLDWLISGGILGLLSYLSLFAIALWFIWFSGKFSVPEKAVFTGLLAAYFFHNLFVFDNLVSYIFFILFLAYFHFRATGTRNEEGHSKKIAEHHFYAASIALVVVVLFSMYFTVVKGVLASSTLIEAISIPTDQVAARVDPFKKALGYNSFADQEIREQIVNTALTVRNQNIDLSGKQAIFTLAREEMEKMIEEAPDDARHRLFYGALLNIYDSPNEALSELQKARELSPNKQQILFEIGLSYINLKNYGEALKIFKEAYELAPAFEDAHIIYAMGSIYAGEKDLEKQLLGGLSDTARLDSRILQAYLNSGRGADAISSITKMIEANPNNGDLLIRRSEVYYRLNNFSAALSDITKVLDANPENLGIRLNRAEVYYRLGNFQSAIADIRFVMEREPNFKAQGERLIQDIEREAGI